MLNIKKKFGFTLAEVLITLGLIGVVSALTIPTLAYNYKGKVLEQQFRATYSELKTIAITLNDAHGGDWATYANDTAYARWYGEFVAQLNGGNQYNPDGTPSNINAILKELYQAPAGQTTGRYPFSINGRDYAGVGDFCDNGGVWIDSKGRIWTFNAENAIVCVDINGTAKPNRLNADIFAFIPMSPEMLAVYVYNDPDNVNNYTGTYVPCDIQHLMGGTGHEDGGKHNVKAKAPYRRGSGTALDACPFYEPVENVAVMDKNPDGTNKNSGTSARGRRVTTSNNYWNDYIEYK